MRALASFWLHPRLDPLLRQADALVARVLGALPRGAMLCLLSGQGNMPLARWGASAGRQLRAAWIF